MEALSVFIGLVSHPKSAFAPSRGSGGLSAQLAVALDHIGIKSVTKVNNVNFFDDSEFPLTAKMARESVRQEIRLESEWFHFLKKSEGLAHSIRMVGRHTRYLLDWRANSKTQELRRLLNIEYSHVDLYRAAVASGSQWAVILEDDAHSTDPAGLARGLVQLMHGPGLPKYINLTTSFSLSKIGIEPLLSVVPDVEWAGSEQCRVLRSERPATNTVCAIAFTCDFLDLVLADFDTYANEPVVPIDWKINASLMRLWDQGVIGPGDCWFVDPGPVAQLSMIQNRAHK